jgi:hypothetical protein
LKNRCGRPRWILAVDLFFAGRPPLFSKVFAHPIENICIARMRPAERTAFWND